VAAGHNVDAAGWRHVLDQVLGAFAGQVARVETRRAAAGFMTGLLADLEVKTSWQLAQDTPARTRCSGCFTERCGKPTPSATMCEP
jgi:hypothetical protein